MHAAELPSASKGVSPDSASEQVDAFATAELEVDQVLHVELLTDFGGIMCRLRARGSRKWRDPRKGQPRNADFSLERRGVTSAIAAV